MRVGAFEVGEEIGRGGMGAVYSARHVSDDIVVALKVLGTMAPGLEHTFDLEVQAMARLSHPSIAMVLDAGRLDLEVSKKLGVIPEAPWLAMELISGDELTELRGKLDWSEIRDFTLGTLDALAHSHALGVVHRDIKPQNIIVERGPGGRVQPKLVDFGIALPIEKLELEGGDPSDKTIMGTPRYMAPEQVDAAWEIQGPPTDLYALACIIWELVTGAPPFTAPAAFVLMLAHLNDPPPEFEPIMAVPAGLEPWLRRLLRKSPMARFRRAADAAWAFRKLGEPVGGPDVAPDVEFDTEGPTIQTLPHEVSFSERSVAEWVADYERPPVPAAAHEFASTDSQVALVGAGLGLVGLRSPPLVGRWPERETLWQSLLLADSTGKPQPVVLHGPAGVGKSRLAEWISRKADELGSAQVLRVMHSQNGGAADGLAPALVRHLRCKGLDSDRIRGAAERWLQDRLRQVDPRLQETIVSVASAAYGEVNASAVFWEPSERHRFFTEVITVLCRERPVILWIDDAQWGRDAVELCHHMLRTTTTDTPVLVVLTLKDDAVQTPSARRVMELGEMGETLPLGGLQADEQIALVRQMLGLAPSLAATVAKRTGGNPLFATQLVRSWVSDNRLIASADGLILDPTITESVPDTVHGLIAADFDRVLKRFLRRAPNAPEMVELAAVLGTEITDEELGAFGFDDAIFESIMRALSTAGYVERTEEGWRFSTSLFRESLDRRSRDAGRLSGHHERCAAMLAERYDDHAVGIAARRAQHLLDAEAYEAAIEPLLLAADLAVEESIAEAQRLVDLLRFAIERVDGDTARADAQTKTIQGSIHLMRGEVDDVMALSAEVEAVAEKNQWNTELARALSQRANALSHQGKPAEALAEYERTLAVLDDGEAPDELARHQISLGIARRRANNVAGAIDACARAVDFYEREGRPRDLVKARSELGCSMLGHGRYEEARTLLRQAAQNAAKLGSSRSEWRALLLEGLLEILDSRWDEARACFARASKVFAVEGIPKVVVELHEAFIQACDGDAREATKRLEGAVDTFETTGLAFELPSVFTALAICAARGTNWDDFDAYIDLANQRISDSGATSLLVAAGADVAASLAASAGRDDLASTARTLAQSQWRALGHPRAS